MQKILLRVGLSKKEADVYLALLEQSSASASEIARLVNLPRQTVYSILQELMEHGLIEQGFKQGAKRFYADTDQLFSFFDKQKRNIEDSRKMLEWELPSLLEKQKKPSHLPMVKYYDGPAGLIQLLDSILEFYKKSAEKLFRGYGINKFNEALGDYLYEFVKKRGQYGVNTRLFIGQGADDFKIKGKANAYGREVKRLGMKPQQAGVYIVGNRIYLFSYPDKVGIMVENENMAQLLTEVFDDHWKKYK
jgi:sugar-specific transcriptional regulator TrmB